MNSKRKLAEKRIIDLMNDIDPSGENANLWKKILLKMSDKEFDEFMKNMYKNPNKYHLNVQLNQSENKKDIILDMDHIEKVAKKNDIKLREYVMFPHLNPDDPEHPFITSTPVPVLVMYIRKMQQMVKKKNFSAGNIDVVNPLTGQVTGDSKAASLGDMQTVSLATTNQTDTIKEFLTIRSDNIEGKLKMLNSIEETGSVRYSDCMVNLNDCQSIQTMNVFLKGAMLKTKGLVQKKKPTPED